ncbi:MULTISPECIES: AAA family ATPase [unclassified Arcobacter]|jgi:MoxR-like ATPase|uniref:AAA family ATPase n=1 Tax=Arcobacter TaxID=28196 RepID=UPI0035D4D980|tara:strand:- start:10483 stop:11436 length:954 start_codon:yes stop_codon:yes gene_type:complete
MDYMNKINEIRSELSKSIIGQQDMIDALLIALLCDGHVLLEGVPGLAKTTAVKALSKCLSLNFKRVQFTPDLIPSDIIGAQIFNMKTAEFSIKKGPIFTNLLLADEINRAPAKVQSALLEVMQEKQVTIADETYSLELPFLVLATQNPIESQGAYELPEAQLDRFMFKILLNYNSKEQEYEIAKSVTLNSFETPNKVASHEDLIELKKAVVNVHIDEELEKYIVNLIFATREPENYGLQEIKDYIQFGASPRATIDMFKAAKAKAFIRGNDHVTPIDIALVFKDIVRHRIVLSYEAQAMDITSDYILQKVIQKVEIP